MDFDEYQKRAIAKAVYPNVGNNITYPVLGICGEAGEVAEKIKKILRDKDGKVADSDLPGIIKEMGDVMWYIAALCNELNIPMSAVARASIEKVEGRHERGTLHGSGDDR